MKTIRILLLLSLCFLCMSCEKDVNLDYLIGEWMSYEKDPNIQIEGSFTMKFIDSQNVILHFGNLLTAEGNFDKKCEYKTDGVYLDIDGDTRYKIILLKKDDMTLYSIKYDNYSYYHRIKE